MRVSYRRFLSGLFLGCSWFPAFANAQTQAFLDAPIVTSVIRVEYDQVSKKIKYALDADKLTHEVPADAMILAKTNTSVVVIYREMNPLRLQATAAITDVDDPAHANIVKLLNAIIAVAKVINPEQVGGVDAEAKRRLAELSASGCAVVDEALPDALDLNATLYGVATTAASIKKEIQNWRKAIDDGFKTGDGESAIEASARHMDNFAERVDKAIAGAKPIVARIEEEARKPRPTERCAFLRHIFYDVLNLTDPAERVQELERLKAAVIALAKTLRDDYGKGHWIDDTDDFLVSSDISPTGKTAKKVVVKVNFVELGVDSATSAIDVGKTAAASTTFTVRKYSRFATEIGAGMVFGFVQRPKYGTGKNAAGETIVAATDNEVSVDPSLMVNFVCRCESGPFVAPMFQIGASTSKSAPAVLAGAGFRLFGIGSGDVAVGVGTVLAFVQELDDLEVGSVVKGTADIEADLKWRPRFRSIDAEGKKHTNWYATIQYQF